MSLAEHQALKVTWFFMASCVWPWASIAYLIPVQLLRLGQQPDIVTPPSLFIGCAVCVILLMLKKHPSAKAHRLRPNGLPGLQRIPMSGACTRNLLTTECMNAACLSGSVWLSFQFFRMPCVFSTS